MTVKNGMNYYFYPFPVHNKRSKILLQIEKPIYTMKYSFFNKFIFRTPSLPCNKVGQILESQQSLTRSLDDAFINEAIYVASPVLHKEIKKYKEGILINKEEISGIIYSLCRYISRMGYRCTPFGLFAACGYGELADKTHIQIREKHYEKATRLDMLYLYTLCDHLLNIPQIKDKLIYFTNSSLYPLGDKYRYIEYTNNKNSRNYQISEAYRTPYLNKILRKAENGASINELTDLLINEDITPEDAKEYIYELINAQLLQNELCQSVTGDDFLTRLSELLHRKASEEVSSLTYIDEIKNAIISLDGYKPAPVSEYDRIIKNIETLKIPFEDKYLFQVDMVKPPVKATIGTSIMEEVRSTLTFLNKLTGLNENPSLKQFRQDFYARYEDCEVPLMEALDTELGLGYPSKSKDGDISPLIDDFAVPSPNQTPTGGSPKTLLHNVLFRKTIACLSEGGEEIILTDEDFPNAHANWDDLPPTFYCMFNIIRDDEEGKLIKMKTAGGSSGANLIARFCHTDKNIDEIVKEITAKEAELIKDVILAEIVYLPESRVGNILYRPHLRDYELLYMANTDLASEGRIPMSDLFLSVRNGRLVIRSKRFNKEIIPRLTNAHNFNNRPLPVYKFLCDMQMPSGRSGMYFTWGSLENDLTFRPRVRYKNTILSGASWSVKVNELEKFFKINDDIKLIEEITLWRKEKHMPRYVLLPDGDNELFVDLENPLIIRSFFSIIKKRPAIILKEFIFDRKNPVIRDENGNGYLNECIVALYKSEI